MLWFKHESRIAIYVAPFWLAIIFGGYWVMARRKKRAEHEALAMTGLEAGELGLAQAVAPTGMRQADFVSPHKVDTPIVKLPQDSQAENVIIKPSKKQVGDSVLVRSESETVPQTRRELVRKTKGPQRHAVSGRIISTRFKPLVSPQGLWLFG